ncbi:DNA repair protein XRCC2 [Hetaerina americana]|uniref:DNA repair protein XRCC2 n=1 Tax=Hetaerina americana TaxID=62018 RepID=UPI003A7F4352
MNYECKAETGIQLLARSGSRPKIKGIDDGLFFRDSSSCPDNGDTLEISGDGSVGKTLFITQLIAQCILPKMVKTEVDIHVGGIGASAILINTDHHFQISKLVQILEQRLKTCFSDRGMDSSDVKISHAIEKHLENSLKKLLTLNCYDSAQLYATFHSLEKHLIDNRSVALLVLDSASSFYWQDVCGNNAMSKRMDNYLKSVVSTLQKCVKGNDVLTIYTRPRYFHSKHPGNLKNSSSSSEGLCKYSIQLARLENEDERIFSHGDIMSPVQYKAYVNTPATSYECRYFISPEGVMHPVRGGN